MHPLLVVRARASLVALGRATRQQQLDQQCLPCSVFMSLFFIAPLNKLLNRLLCLTSAPWSHCPASSALASMVLLMVHTLKLGASSYLKSLLSDTVPQQLEKWHKEHHYSRSWCSSLVCPMCMHCPSLWALATAVMTLLPWGHSVTSECTLPPPVRSYRRNLSGLGSHKGHSACFITSTHIPMRTMGFPNVFSFPSVSNKLPVICCPQLHLFWHMGLRLGPGIWKPALQASTHGRVCSQACQFVCQRLQPVSRERRHSPGNGW